MALLPKSHPYWFLRASLDTLPEIAQFSFSYYKYTPQTIADDRLTIDISRDEFMRPEFIADFLQGGPIDREISLNSLVTMSNGQLLHLPMVDMSTGAKAQLHRLNSFVEETIFEKFVWFASGRSFHGYGNYLLSQQDWAKLMGTLLPSNQKGMAPLVDPRWIGHRLLAGYSALRWTKKTRHYINSPTQIEERFVGQHDS